MAIDAHKNARARQMVHPQIHHNIGRPRQANSSANNFLKGVLVRILGKITRNFRTSKIELIAGTILLYIPDVSLKNKPKIITDITIIGDFFKSIQNLAMSQ